MPPILQHIIKSRVRKIAFHGCATALCLSSYVSTVAAEPKAGGELKSAAVVGVTWSGISISIGDGRSANAWANNLTLLPTSPTYVRPFSVLHYTSTPVTVITPGDPTVDFARSSAALFKQGSAKFYAHVKKCQENPKNCTPTLQAFIKLIDETKTLLDDIDLSSDRKQALGDEILGAGINALFRYATGRVKENLPNVSPDIALDNETFVCKEWSEILYLTRPLIMPLSNPSYILHENFTVNKQPEFVVYKGEKARQTHAVFSDWLGSPAQGYSVYVQTVQNIDTGDYVPPLTLENNKIRAYIDELSRMVPIEQQLNRDGKTGGAFFSSKYEFTIDFGYNSNITALLSPPKIPVDTLGSTLPVLDISTTLADQPQQIKDRAMGIVLDTLIFRAEQDDIRLDQELLARNVDKEKASFHARHEKFTALPPVVPKQKPDVRAAKVQHN